MIATRRMMCLGCLVASASLAAALTVGATPRGMADEKEASDPAVERARQQVKMLDELYKTAVVSITEKYRRGQPAIMVAKDIFKAMENGRYHSARLVDATGAPLGEGNVPKTDFEKRAAEAMRAGKTHLEEVVGRGDDRRYLAATVVPAVHPRCAECHGVKQGELLGFIRYEVPLR
jgi:hypothetical protein